MALVRDNGRTRVRVARVDFTFASTDDAGVAIGLVGAHTITLFTMPVDSVVVAGGGFITTAFTSTDQTTLTVGDATVADRYLTVADFEPAAVYAFVPTGFVITSTQPTIRAVYTVVTSANTAGVGSFWVQYLVKSKRTVNPDSIGA